MRQLQLAAHGEPSDVIELHTVSEPALGQEEVLVSMEAAPRNPSDFLLVRGFYGVRPPAFLFAVGAEEGGTVCGRRGGIGCCFAGAVGKDGVLRADPVGEP